MAELNQKEMAVDDDIENIDSEDQAAMEELNPSKLPWYMLDADGTVVYTWNFVITVLLIYEMFVNPFILVFPEIYMTRNADGKYEATEGKQKLYVIIELIIDILYVIEIIFNFFKKQRGHKDVADIAKSYISFYFIFDLIGTLPVLCMGENYEYYYLKLFRCLAHVKRITDPLAIVLMYLLRNFSQKRQGDLCGFVCLLFFTCYVCHCMGCIWLKLGFMYPCLPEEDAVADTVSSVLALDSGPSCIQSWIYANEWSYLSMSSLYICAFYWIFEVITTVGYGDYCGATTEEYIFSVLLEFMGLIFFSGLMGNINGLFDQNDSFEDLIQEKLDALDMWVKKIEKSNHPYHLQPLLYNDIRKYVEQAYKYDFNLLIEEFEFYQQITPKMQTKLIKATQTFDEFEKNFEHFFGECERGFINELIINMFCRLFTHGKVVLPYRSHVKQFYFIREGIVEIFNHENDEVIKDLAVMYMPKYSYFGDYQILKGLKSNVVIKTLSLEKQTPPNQGEHQCDPAEVIFMCVDKETLLDLCQLFPQTKENIKRKAMERRARFIKWRNLNSRRYWSLRGSAQYEHRPHKVIEGSMTLDKIIYNEVITEQKKLSQFIAEYPYMENIRNDDQYQSDEEPENSETQNEDMKIYLKEANQRVDILIDVLKKGVDQIQGSGTHRNLVRDPENPNEFKKKTMAMFFEEQVDEQKIRLEDIDYDIDEQMIAENAQGMQTENVTYR